MRATCLIPGVDDAATRSDQRFRQQEGRYRRARAPEGGRLKSDRFGKAISAAGVKGRDGQGNRIGGGPHGTINCRVLNTPIHRLNQRGSGQRGRWVEHHIADNKRNRRQGAIIAVTLIADCHSELRLSEPHRHRSPLRPDPTLAGHRCRGL